MTDETLIPRFDATFDTAKSSVINSPCNSRHNARIEISSFDNS